MAAACALARGGFEEVTVLERAAELGGLAGTFEQGEHFYPLAYHHILHRDRTLHYFLDTVGALDRVRWRRIHMLFHLNGKNYDFANPIDFLRYPMSLADKARFVGLMLRSFRKSGWDDWIGRSAAELVDGWAGPGVRHAMFEPLCGLKFDLSCEQTSGAWLGARLHAREGSSPLGYIPGCNWTQVLCDGITRLLEARGVRVRVRTTVKRLHAVGDRIGEVEVESGPSVSADVVVSTLPTEVYTLLAPHDRTAGLESIRYTAVISVIFATRQPVRPEFYWMNMMSRDTHASGLFVLDSLNPTIGAPGESVLNFMTHVPGREREFFRRSDDEVVSGYLEDFAKVFGHELQPSWTHISRLPMYSPVFSREYRNLPVRSETWRNVYFAGNYRTFPSVASTGTALGSGLEAAQAILEEDGRTSDLFSEARAFVSRGPV
jgi:protoporphyrinogen oxidase